MEIVIEKIMVLPFILQAIIAFLMTYGGIWLLRKIAGKRFLDVPNERSSHVAPTPRGAGVAIVLVTLLFFLLPSLLGFSFNLPWQIYVGAILIAGISLIDDYRSLPNWLRFGFHFAGAILAINALGFFRIIEIPLFGFMEIGWLGLPLTVLWIVGLTNIYNFMDGIDGIAGTQALVTGIGWLLIGFLFINIELAWFGIVVMLTGFAFLLHNWSPAKIFLGDVGSAFWGFLFAVVPLWAENRTGKSFFLIGILTVWIFLFDGVLTIFRRAFKGENIFAAHRSHLYQRLVIKGFSHSFVTKLYGILGIFGIACVIVAASNPQDLGKPDGLKTVLIILILIFGFGLFIGDYYLDKQKQTRAVNEVK
jgi:Fuc2NAc and GlcNAc transferase